MRRQKQGRTTPHLKQDRSKLTGIFLRTGEQGREKLQKGYFMLAIIVWSLFVSLLNCTVDIIRNQFSSEKIDIDAKYLFQKFLLFIVCIICLYSFRVFMKFLPSPLSLFFITS